MSTLPPAQPLPPTAPNGKSVMLVLVLLGLALLVAILWFADPAHQWPGRSRVDWPAPEATKP